MAADYDYQLLFQDAAIRLKESREHAFHLQYQLVSERHARIDEIKQIITAGTGLFCLLGPLRWELGVPLFLAVLFVADSFARRLCGMTDRKLEYPIEPYADSFESPTP